MTRLEATSGKIGAAALAGPHVGTLALAGNPNCGKTSIFNALTGARQHVGNWPGVTVERKEGTARLGEKSFNVIDLPGVYSLHPHSAEEQVARDYIIRCRPDVIVNIVDCSNLDRNLYLTTQLLELGAPIVLAMNMWDMATRQEILIDVAMLSQLLGVPVVPTVGVCGKGMAEVLAAAERQASDPAAALAARRQPTYGSEIEPHVQQLCDQMVLAQLLEPSAGMCTLVRHRRHLACQLLEDDANAADLVRELAGPAAEAILDKAATAAAHIERTMGQSCELLLAQQRYGFIAGACAETVRRPKGAHKRTRSDRIDTVLTHRWLGLPIFALMMYLVFQFTFTVGNPLVDLLDNGKEMLAQSVRDALTAWPLVSSLLADGVIEGVGAVLSFLPLILLLYLAIAVLEDSGYMARAAFVLDRLMHRIGLHGKSFIPMVMGFGCTVPAIMATRILETRRDRLTTMMVLPLMSCGARLPVYVLLIGAFFSDRAVLALGPVSVTQQALVLFGIYVIGIVLAVLSIKLLRATVFRGESTPFVMELPPYRRPALRGLAIHMWERGWMYVRKAGTIILLIVVVLWAAKTWPQLPAERVAEFDRQRAAAMQHPDAGLTDAAVAEINVRQAQAQLANSAIGRLGHTVAPVLAPAGQDWKIATAMLGALAAKEVFVGQMGVIYAVSDDAPEDSSSMGATLREKIAHDYTPLQGLCMMLLVLIATPCVATLAVTARESGSWKWVALQWSYLTTLAWVVATAVYQIGHALNLG